MNPLLKDLREPVIGSALIVRSDEGHNWYRGESGSWYCTCDGDTVDWTWEEVVDDVGAFETNYYVEVPA